MTTINNARDNLHKAIIKHYGESQLKDILDCMQAGMEADTPEIKRLSDKFHKVWQENKHIEYPNMHNGGTEK